MEILRRHHISFKNAFAGIKWALHTQPNFRVHFFFAILALILGYVLKISPVEFTILILTIAYCLGIEMVNTSIESMTDLITLEWKKEAKIAKDVAAGMMLFAAFSAILIAVCIFIPKIISLFS
jgi:diacylglycerol kinase